MLSNFFMALFLLLSFILHIKRLCVLKVIVLVILKLIQIYMVCYFDDNLLRWLMGFGFWSY
jgi:hypothetical protein